jgi:hypothetical protein
MVDKLIETYAKLIGILIAVMMLPCLLSAIVQAIGTFHLMLGFGILCVVAYLRHQNRAPVAGRRKAGAGAERTPLIPKGDD